MIIIHYVIPVFIMFASTFKVLTGLSLAIVLARFLARRGAVLTGLSLAIVLARFFLHGEERRDASLGTHSMEIAASRR